MTDDFATRLRLEVISAETDTKALHAVADAIRDALLPIRDGARLDLWATEIEKYQFTALTGYLERVARLVTTGTAVLINECRDEAWVLLAAAARTVDAILDIHEDTDPEFITEDCHLQVHEITGRADTPDASVFAPICVTASVDGPVAAVTGMADTLLRRTPEVFLDEQRLYAAYTDNAWELLRIARTHVDRHIEAWDGVESLRTILDGAEHARAERDALFPSAA